MLDGRGDHDEQQRRRGETGRDGRDREARRCHDHEPRVCRSDRVAIGEVTVAAARDQRRRAESEHHRCRLVIMCTGRERRIDQRVLEPAAGETSQDPVDPIERPARHIVVTRGHPGGQGGEHVTADHEASDNRGARLVSAFRALGDPATAASAYGTASSRTLSSSWLRTSRMMLSTSLGSMPSVGDQLVARRRRRRRAAHPTTQRAVVARLTWYSAAS